MASVTMDQIIDELDTARQRATYGAIAAVLGVSPRALMSGRERTQRHSWIVNLKNGLPTDYAEELMHPELQSNSTIIKTKEDLVAWLKSHGLDLSTERAA